MLLFVKRYCSVLLSLDFDLSRWCTLFLDCLLVLNCNVLF